MIVMMDDIKLPDLSGVREGRKQPLKLPPQKSAQDTSNWDDRAFSAPLIDVERELMFSHDPSQVFPR